MSIYRRWLQVSSDLASIVTAILSVWAIPLFHEQGVLPVLPAGLMLALGWLAVTAAGCLGIWLRSEWDRTIIVRWVAAASLPQTRGTAHGEAV